MEERTVDPRSLLAGLRVVERCGEIGSFGGKLLAGLGAEVVRLAGADPPSSRTDYLNAEKRLVSPDDLPSFLATADVVLDDALLPLPSQREWTEVRVPTPRQAVPRDIGAPSPGAAAPPSPVAMGEEAGRTSPVQVVIAPFGLSGPRRAHRATDLITQAASGLLSQIGTPPAPPSRVAGQLAWSTAGAAGAVGALLGLRVRERIGRSPLVEVSAQEACIACTEGGIGITGLSGRVLPRTGGVTFQGTRTTRRCRDGFVVGTIGRRWDAFLDWMDERGISTARYRDPAWEEYGFRLQHAAEMDGLIDRLFASMTRDEIAEGSRRRRFIIAPIQFVSDLLADPQLAHRRFFVPLPNDPATLQPGLPYQFRSRITAPVPPQPRGGGLPLAGLRVVDLGSNIAVPLVTKFFALFGAEVIKVESRRRPDSMRTVPAPPPIGSATDDTMNWLWANTNAGKRSIVLDLGSERGRDFFLDLVKTADVVMDNYGPDPMERWRLTYEHLAAVKPDLVMLRSSVMGRRGPLSHAAGTGQSIAAAGGLVGLTGPPGEDPVGFGVAYPDFTTSFHLALLAALAALHHRDRTGIGLEIDLSQVEGVVSVLGGDLIEMQRRGVDPPPAGNREPGYRLHAILPAAGEDRWIAVAATPDDWPALLALVEKDDPASAAELGAATDVAEIERLAAGWTATYDARLLAERLQAVGVPASPVETARDLLDEAHLRERGFFPTVDQPAMGPLPVIGSHLRLDGVAPAFSGPAPLLGEQTDAILAELGLDEEAINGLYVDGVLS